MPEKRVRKKKGVFEPSAEPLVLEEQLVLEEPLVSEPVIDLIMDPNDEENEKPTKKRGRKPKGGKIIPISLSTIETLDIRPNVILHLKCSIKDLQLIGDYDDDLTSSNIDAYHGKNDLTFDVLDKDIPMDMYDPSSFYLKCNEEAYEETETKTTTATATAGSSTDMKEIQRKLKILEKTLHTNCIQEKKSACFWCTCDFDNPPIFIPKHYIKNSFHVYGCFCTPECAVAYLMNENMDSSTKFERFQLINHVYSKIYEYKKNIKPAPSPYYMLDKYYGNITIQEYRALLKTERLFLVVDKPLTRILPEFHEDNDDFILNNKIIPSNHYQIKKKGAKSATPSKGNIVYEKFGLVPAQV